MVRNATSHPTATGSVLGQQSLLENEIALTLYVITHIVDSNPLRSEMEPGGWVDKVRLHM